MNIRIDEYHTMLARDDEQKRKDFYEKFAAVAKKYLGLQYDRKIDPIVSSLKSYQCTLEQGIPQTEQTKPY